MEDYNITQVKGRRKKTNIPFNTFFNSEGTDMLNVYLKDRERKGEEITDDSYLFVARKKDGSISRLRNNSFSEDLKKATKTLGYKNITPKRLRDWFRSELRRAGVTEEIIKRMMGHKCDVSAVYEQMFNEREEFAKFYAVDKDVDAITSLGNGNKKLKKVEVEVKELKQENFELRNDVSNMKKEFEEFKNLVSKYMGRSTPILIEDEVDQVKIDLDEKLKKK